VGVGDAARYALREPAPSEDLYRWRDGYILVRGRVWFNRSQGVSLEQADVGEIERISASAIFMKGKPIDAGWGVCVAVGAGESCDYRITLLTDRGAFWRVELAGIPPAYRG
jgi:hypothetical protein